jgi:predicted patatin/cPLA2 family phospholipase
MKKGLVMEGGAMRGLYTAGVTDVLMKYGIKFDGAVGVSAGVTFGCNYKSLQPGRVLRYNLRYGSRPQFKSWRSWLKTGDLYGADFCYYTDLPEVLDPFDTAAFARNPHGLLVRGNGCGNGPAGLPQIDHRQGAGRGLDPGFGLDSRFRPAG